MSKKINQIEPDVTSQDIDEVTKYMNSDSWITEHKITSSLENQISNIVGRKHSVAVPNGTIAIYLSLVANGITKGKRVAVPNITMIATINAVIWADAIPVLIDVDSNLTMSINSLKEQSNIDAVIFVPLNGRTGDGLEIENYCNENKILLIEDSAHALGSNYVNKNCGALGDTSIFSFTPHKIITMGQGGMVLTDDTDTYEELISLKTFNREKDKSDWHAGFGLNFKITDLQSALGLSQLSRLDSLIQKKKDLFNYFFNSLENVEMIEFKEHETPWFVDIILSSEQECNELADYLEKESIETRFCYPPLSLQKYLTNTEQNFLNHSIDLAKRILWLPSSTKLNEKDLDRIIVSVNKFFK